MTDLVVRRGLLLHEGAYGLREEDDDDMTLLHWTDSLVEIMPMWLVLVGQLN